MGTTPNNGYFQDGSPLIPPIVLYGPNGQPISTTNPLAISLQVDAVTATVTNDGTFAKENGGNLATLVTNTTGLATSANQATTNTSLSNISTVEGATSDAAVTGDTAGSHSAKLRGLSKILADIWDSVNHRIKVDGSGVTQPVSGTFWQATQPVSGTVTANQGGTWTVQPGNTANTTAWKVDASGAAVPITQPTSATSTITSVAGAASSTQLLASNTSRKGMFVFNDSTAILYLAFAGSASTTAYTVQVPANSFFEMPVAPVYTGAIFGIWSAANGNARITELT